MLKHVALAALSLAAIVTTGIGWRITPHAMACPFCSAVSQTLRQEMASTDAVVIARIVPGSETESTAQFLIERVIQGDGLVKPEQVITVNYFGKAKPEQRFLLMGVDPPELLWSSPLPISETAIDYVQSIKKLPEDPIARLKFYLPYLEHPDSMLARDAYDEFASAPYGELKQLKDSLDRRQLLQWVQDTSLPPDRKRLYFVLLGICGQPEDTEILERLLRSEDPDQRAGLDALIACYITLKGESALDLVDELFLKNEQSRYADTYAAIMALRFHGTEGGVVPKERVLQSMRLLLMRPQLADLVIPDLARWEDWSQIDRLVQLFKTADETTSWVRVPVINYLRACPLPEAEAALQELKEIDPAAYKRATSYFPVPRAGDGSSTRLPDRMRHLVSDRPLGGPGPFAASTATAIPSTSLSVRRDLPPPPNRLLVTSVVGMAAVTVWLTMWLAISGAGRSPLA
ncbi:MAG: hypothetical protein KatS3mg111_1735 [Pirellulaceae bacterium]|nr:MAG: hypothetical protein KatS3mg111_1735 [Pirellulaceae bacterium]